LSAFPFSQYAGAMPIYTVIDWHAGVSFYLYNTQESNGFINKYL